MLTVERLSVQIAAASILEDVALEVRAVSLSLATILKTLPW